MQAPTRLSYALGSMVVIMVVSPAAVFSSEGQKPVWTVTDEQRAAKNPAAPSAESAARGKPLYVKNCLACHGATGDGKGPVAARLGFWAGNLTRGDEMAQKTDGELFWKIAQGRDPMPAFRKEKGLTDTQMWEIVNYVRTLAVK